MRPLPLFKIVNLFILKIFNLLINKCVWISLIFIEWLTHFGYFATRTPVGLFGPTSFFEHQSCRSHWIFRLCHFSASAHLRNSSEPPCRDRSRKRLPSFVSSWKPISFSHLLIGSCGLRPLWFGVVCNIKALFLILINVNLFVTRMAGFELAFPSGLGKLEFMRWKCFNLYSRVPYACRRFLVEAM